MENYSSTLKTLKILKDLFQDQSLSEIAIRIAGATLVDHEIARIKGEPVEGTEDMAWAVEKLEQLIEEGIVLSG